VCGGGDVKLVEDETTIRHFFCFKEERKICKAKEMK
jgi:hypothetical protein